MNYQKGQNNEEHEELMRKKFAFLAGNKKIDSNEHQQRDSASYTGNFNGKRNMPRGELKLKANYLNQNHNNEYNFY